MQQVPKYIKEKPYLFKPCGNTSDICSKSTYLSPNQLHYFLIPFLIKMSSVSLSFQSTLFSFYLNAPLLHRENRSD